MTAGSQGLGRFGSFFMYSVSLVAGVYFLGWWAIVTSIVGMFAGIKGLSDKKIN
jgi:hypothetical protein